MNLGRTQHPSAVYKSVKINETTRKHTNQTRNYWFNFCSLPQTNLPAAALNDQLNAASGIVFVFFYKPRSCQKALLCRATYVCFIGTIYKIHIHVIIILYTRPSRCRWLRFGNIQPITKTTTCIVNKYTKKNPDRRRIISNTTRKKRVIKTTQSAKRKVI